MGTPKIKSYDRPYSNQIVSSLLGPGVRCVGLGKLDAFALHLCPPPAPRRIPPHGSSTGSENRAQVLTGTLERSADARHHAIRTCRGKKDTENPVILLVVEAFFKEWKCVTGP
jgi:hypothetical protein